MKAVSIIIPWCNREDLAISLLRNSEKFSKNFVEVIIVNGGGSSDLLKKLLEEVSIENTKYITLAMPDFNKSLSLNAGVYHSSHDQLFFLDCDVILETELSSMIQTLKKGSFVTLNKIKETAREHEGKKVGTVEEIAYSITIRDIKGAEINVETNRINLLDSSRSGPGLLLCHKHDFLKVGGMNSELQGWGWEDIDIVYRLQHLGLVRKRVGNCSHLSHSDKERFLVHESKALNEQINFKMALANYMAGNFLGTYERDVKKLYEEKQDDDKDN
ncbi:hypothetical protein MNBD_BACTEROID03-1562 [hydrothermal vent metagenome]|uniref:Uncharacterized protein n=1 Tax=hydrothermal vent metagenome TaxID=652676 RepID=A0A3B0TD20_9ZZZZ